MTRLTRDIKKTILIRAIEQSPIVKEIKNIKQKLANLAIEIYNDNVTKEQIDDAFKIQTDIKISPFQQRWCIDDNWFYMWDFLDVNFGGMRERLEFTDNVNRPELRKKPTYQADHEFSKRYIKLQNKHEDLLKQQDALRAEITAILNSCATIKKLQQIWPESINFITYIKPKTSNTLPTIDIADLNKKLDISAE